MRIIKILLTVLLLCLSWGAIAQNFTVSGTVRDSLTGEPLVGANIIVAGSQRGASTDGQGRYSLSLVHGNYSLTASYIGYATKIQQINLVRNTTLNINLASNTTIGEVVVQSRRADSNVRELTMGTERMTVAEVRKLPALMGEVDILKAIALLPGVQNTSEGSSGFSVRGGSPDQNLILLDNTPVYNASHLMGFFSVFNNDAIAGLELYKGDLPLRYGGRISSLLDVKSRSEIPERFQGTGGLGVISSRIMLEMPIGSDFNWMVAGRRSYADIFLLMSNNKSLRESSIFFYDLNGKLTWRATRNNIFEATAYHGRDNFGANIGAFKYGNTAAALAWKHFFNDDIRLNTSFNYTRYGYEMGGSIDTMSMRWTAYIEDFSLRADVDHRLSDDWSLTYGASTTYHDINPGVVWTSVLPEYAVDPVAAWESAVYASSEQKLTDWLSIRYGLRGVMFDNNDPTKPFWAVEPRAGALFMLSPSSSIKANYSNNTQFVQVASNTASGSPLDVWFPASTKIPPQRAHIFALGYFKNFRNNAWELSVEGYYKALSNVIDFRDNTRLVGNRHLEDDILIGNGQAYGIEIQLRRNIGKLNGFINYTLARSERRIDGINGGRTYLAPYDKTHSINIVLNWEISPQVTASLTWIYATGIPTTYPVGRFVVGDESFPIYSDRNEYRYPDYHRLDIGVEWTPTHTSRSRWHSSWNFSVYNVYNQKNPWMINFRQNHTTGMPYAEMTYLFGIVPSITYNFKF